MSEYFMIEQMEDVEVGLVAKLREYFHTKLNIQDMFKNFGALRIDETHPFAILNAASVSSPTGTIVVPAGTFPSITVSTVDDNIGSAQPLNLERQVVVIDEDWVANQVGFSLVNQTQVQELLAYIRTTGNKVYGSMAVDRSVIRTSMSVWAENRELKSFIYAQLRSFMYQYRGYIEQTLGLQNLTIGGTPSGLYNMDLGRVLYGAEVTLTADRNVANIYVNTDWVDVKNVDMYVDHILS